MLCSEGLDAFLGLLGHESVCLLAGGAVGGGAGVRPLTKAALRYAVMRRCWGQVGDVQGTHRTEPGGVWQGANVLPVAECVAAGAYLCLWPVRVTSVAAAAVNDVAGHRSTFKGDESRLRSAHHASGQDAGRRGLDEVSHQGFRGGILCHTVNDTPA